LFGKALENSLTMQKIMGKGLAFIFSASIRLLERGWL